jgi:hypothetical protein
MDFTPRTPPAAKAPTSFRVERLPAPPCDVHIPVSLVGDERPRNETPHAVACPPPAPLFHSLGRPPALGSMTCKIVEFSQIDDKMRSDAGIRVLHRTTRSCSELLLSPAPIYRSKHDSASRPSAYSRRGICQPYSCSYSHQHAATIAYCSFPLINP